jgi:ribosomal protein S18 acetylase RimI-like enzyme
LGRALMTSSLNRNFRLVDGFGKMDFERVTEMLKGAWWSKGISITEVKQGARNSALVVGVFTSDGLQIGYSRAISDKTRFAYILDVYVDERYRRKGIGQSMIRYILSHSELKDVYQWLLITEDAHGVYRKVGFKELESPDKWMEIRRPRPDR